MSAKRLMICGTMSGVGKSVLCSALCRIFTQDGLNTAPFKSQNMALNSAVTADGKEIGRAQALQALACKKEPDVRMNPILLKPESDTGSQVVLNGIPAGTTRGMDYFHSRQKLIPDILTAFKSLAAENDLIMIEGAGSPAEINLKQNDIVNLGLAKLLDAPVLLVGDIDPGGVFAQLYGTYMLLEPEERKRVKGFLINKFRGDEGLLTPGLRTLEKLTGIPVLGVIPYLSLDLDEEDSLSEKLSQANASAGRSGKPAADIAIVRLPHLSNYTDFDPLYSIPDVRVRYVTKAKELGFPDLLILPGTKNTTGDLAWLKETGLFDPIREFGKTGGFLLGICGGYQMLGKGITENGCRREGLGLLPAETFFSEEKTLFKTKAKCLADFSDASVSGYQIHMGRTKLSEDARPFFACEDGSTDGAIRKTVYGTYLHGLFDEGDFALDLIRLAGHAVTARQTEKAGRPVPEDPSVPSHTESRQKTLDRELDRLADTVRVHIDMETIRRVIETEETAASQ